MKMAFSLRCTSEKRRRCSSTRMETVATGNRRQFGPFDFSSSATLATPAFVAHHDQYLAGAIDDSDGRVVALGFAFGKGGLSDNLRHVQRYGALHDDSLRSRAA